MHACFCSIWFSFVLQCDSSFPPVKLQLTNCCIGQDSAPARQTIELLLRETPKFVLVDFWRLSSPHISPVDCRMWGMMQDRVYQTPVWDVTDLRQRLIDTWNSLLQSIVDDAIDE